MHARVGLEDDGSRPRVVIKALGALADRAGQGDAGCMVVATLGPESEGKLVYFMTVDDARFRKPVVTGDQMYVHVTKVRSRGPVWKFTGEAKVDCKLVAQATYSAMILDE